MTTRQPPHPLTPPHKGRERTEYAARAWAQTNTFHSEAVAHTNRDAPAAGRAPWYRLSMTTA